MSKKDWVKPELIIIERSNPEEMVLTACKLSGSRPAGGLSNHDSSNSGCQQYVCGSCSTLTGS